MIHGRWIVLAQLLQIFSSYCEQVAYLTSFCKMYLDITGNLGRASVSESFSLRGYTGNKSNEEA
jgi:hypothetical protein